MVNAQSFHQIPGRTMRIPDIFNNDNIVFLIEPVYYLESFVDVTGAIFTDLPCKQGLLVSRFRETFQFPCY